ncbi:MAG: hypothetical protein BWY12_01360 [candidate division BRC1 bacterium ADurb.Bin183]|nr:MAG: hypothetical protein BWY12_01360 [candidate division BRC1 bacterium ADurb.Bin183]
MHKKLIVFLIFFLGVMQITCGQEIQFKTTTPLRAGRQMAGAVVLGDYLYVISGNVDGMGYSNSVEMAKINPDGTLGEWKNTTPLPTDRSYIDNSTLVLNDIVYVVAGKHGSLEKRTNTIYWTRPLPTGELEPWRESFPFPGNGVQCAPAVATQGYIHLLGGLESNSVSDKVWAAKVGGDGSIISWEEENPLPTPLWYHNAGVAGGRVWVWGGLINIDSSPTDNITPQRAVYFAPILPSGKLGAWMQSPNSLPKGFFCTSSTVSGPFLLSFCARYGTLLVSNDIWFANVTKEGISNWTCQPSNIKARLYICLATDYRRGIVYIPGGRIKRDDFVFDNNVYYVKLASGQKEDDKTDAAVTMDQSAQQKTGSTLSYMTQAKETVSSRAGFLPYNQAQYLVTQQSKPLAIYFCSAKAKKCQEQDRVLSGLNLDSHSGKVVFAMVETSQFPQIAQQHGVFRVPVWIFYDVSGVEKIRKDGVLQPVEIDEALKQVAP